MFYTGYLKISDIQQRIYLMQRVEEKKDDSSVGMSDHEFSDLMVMCGNPRDGDSLLLPDWVLECAKKGSDSWKLTTIMKHIMNNAFYIK